MAEAVPTISGVTSNFARLLDFETPNNGFIADLPASGDPPLEIDPTRSTIMQVVIISSAEFYMTYTNNSVDAATIINSNASRIKVPAGLWNFDALGNTGKMYVKATGAAVVGGLSIVMQGVT